MDTVAHAPAALPDAYRLNLSPDLVEAVLSGPEQDAAFRAAVDAHLARDDFGVLPIGALCADYPAFRAACDRVATALGTPMVQNDQGATVIEVYDRNVGRIEDGARYHQTRQGGDIHTDSVNRPEPMDYLILACAAPALIGGESIMVRGREVYDRLLAYPEVIETLSQPFWFEGRGMSAEMQLFQLPVLTVKDGDVAFRYLRSYIASAHDRAGAPLTPDQVYAFDVLDAVIELSEMQHRFTLGQGDLLIASDVAVFHGRTGFVDGVIPGAWTQGRCMLRYWIE